MTLRSPDAHVAFFPMPHNAWGDVPALALEHALCPDDLTPPTPPASRTHPAKHLSRRAGTPELESGDPSSGDPSLPAPQRPQRVSEPWGLEQAYGLGSL